MPTLRQQIREYFDARPLPDLKVDVLLREGRTVAGAGETAKKSRIVAFPRWTRLLALAAALLVFAGLAASFLTPRSGQVSFAALAPQVIDFFDAPELRKLSQNKSELRQWLLANGAPAEFAIPAKLLPLESFGCSVLNVKGRPAYLTCFWRNTESHVTGSDEIHLLAVRRGDFRDTPSGTSPQFRELRGWSFASWSEGEVTYTLAAAAPMDKVRPFLTTRSADRRSLLAGLSF